MTIPVAEVVVNTSSLIKGLDQQLIQNGRLTEYVKNELDIEDLDQNKLNNIKSVEECFSVKTLKGTVDSLFERIINVVDDRETYETGIYEDLVDDLLYNHVDELKTFFSKSLEQDNKSAKLLIENEESMDLIYLYNHFILDHANKKDLISLNNASTGDLDHLFDNKNTLHLVMSLWMKDDPQLNKNFERMLSQLPELKTDEIYIYDEDKNDGYSFKVFNVDLLRDLIQIRVANAIRSDNFDNLIVDEKTLNKLEDLKKMLPKPKEVLKNYLLTFEGCGSVIYNFKQEELNHHNSDSFLNNIDDCSSVIDEKLEIDVLKTQIIAALKENYPEIILTSDFDLEFYADGDELEVNAENNIKYTGSLSIYGTIPFRANSKDSVDEIESCLTYSVVNCIDDYLMNTKQKDTSFKELSLGDFAQSVKKPLDKKTDKLQDENNLKSKYKIHI